MGLRENLEKLNEQIAKAANTKAKKAEDITVVVAVKYASVDQIKSIIELGLMNIGENTAQRLTSIKSEINSSIRWHFIGHLQMNKVKKVVGVCDLIQSVDSVKLLNEIDNRANLLGIVQSILIQIKVSDEPTKFGLDVNEFDKFLEKSKECKNVKIDGLMAIPPILSKNETRKYFKKSKKYFDKIEGVLNRKPKFLSIGMSNDFEIAIEEGSNMIRVGTILFGG